MYRAPSHQPGEPYIESFIIRIELRYAKVYMHMYVCMYIYIYIYIYIYGGRERERERERERDRVKMQKPMEWYILSLFSGTSLSVLWLWTSMILTQF